MNVAAQRRKLTHQRDWHPDLEVRVYFAYLVGLFDGYVVVGVPQPARSFVAMYEEEFGT